MWQRRRLHRRRLLKDPGVRTPGSSERTPGKYPFERTTCKVPTSTNGFVPSALGHGAHEHTDPTTVSCPNRSSFWKRGDVQQCQGCTKNCHLRSERATRRRIELQTGARALLLRRRTLCRGSQGPKTLNLEGLGIGSVAVVVGVEHQFTIRYGDALPPL